MVANAYYKRTLVPLSVGLPVKRFSSQYWIKLWGDETLRIIFGSPCYTVFYRWFVVCFRRH